MKDWRIVIVTLKLKNHEKCIFCPEQDTGSEDTEDGRQAGLHPHLDVRRTNLNLQVKEYPQKHNCYVAKKFWLILYILHKNINF